jgi:hypothetical protein
LLYDLKRAGFTLPVLRFTAVLVVWVQILRGFTPACAKKPAQVALLTYILAVADKRSFRSAFRSDNRRDPFRDGPVTDHRAARVGGRYADAIGGVRRNWCGDPDPDVFNSPPVA